MANKCFICGSEVRWNSDFDYEDLGIEGVGIVHIYSCPQCGADIEVYETITEDKTN